MVMMVSVMLMLVFMVTGMLWGMFAVLQPKARNRIPCDASDPTYLLQGTAQRVLDLVWNSEQQPPRGADHQRVRSRDNEDCNNARGDGVPAGPARVRC